MKRRIGSYVLLALLVTLAGCLGGVGEGAQPSGGSSTGGGSGDGGGGGGGGDSAVANRTAVLAAAGSYTSTWQLRVSEGGEVVGETTYVTAIDYAAERSLFRSTGTSDGESRDGWEIYHADGTVYTRYGADESASYVVSEDVFTGTSPFDTGRYVTDGSDLAEFERVGTDTFDGVQVTRYELTERPAWIAGQQVRDDEVRWTEFTFEVLIDDDGLVRSERWTSTGVDDQDVTHTVEFSSTITGIGSTTVAEPAWIETARERASQ